jgi:hypothetical protein
MSPRRRPDTVTDLRIHSLCQCHVDLRVVTSPTRQQVRYSIAIDCALGSIEQRSQKRTQSGIKAESRVAASVVALRGVQVLKP